MNNRINEFITESTVVTEIYNEATGLTHEREFFDKEKFAQLIVKECADIANKQFSVASGLDDRDCWTAVEIKQHFGVKE